jgi:D-3-phosphoglycerate dehydrogenase
MNSPFKIVAIKHTYPNMDIEREIVERAGGQFVNADGLADPDWLRECESADAILVRWSRITPEVISKFHRCKTIVRYGIGYDNVDVKAATDAKIIVGHIPNYSIDEVSTHAIALLLACARNVMRTHQKIQRGGWDENQDAIRWRTSGKTLGLVGLGNIGRAVARKMSTWGMRLLATDPFVDQAKADAVGVKLVDLETLCRESDYVTIHVPLLPETRHLIGRRELAWMKPACIVVNTARGPVLDGTALVNWLNANPLSAAGLDVFEQEPIPLDSPIRSHPRMVLSDHVAWYSEESFHELRVTAAEECVRVCTGGLPRAIANPEVLEKLGRWSEWQMNDTVRWQLKRLERLKNDPSYGQAGQARA